MKDEKCTSGIAFRPLAGTEKMTTAPEEHPQNVVYCLSKKNIVAIPQELVEAYHAVYGENNGIDAVVIARIPCNASQLLARELRKEGDRDIVLAIYHRNGRVPEIPEIPEIVDLRNGNKKKFIEFLEAHPHRNSIEVIDEYLNH